LALAHADCTANPKSEWKSETEARAKFENDGYQITKFCCGRRFCLCTEAAWISRWDRFSGADWPLDLHAWLSSALQIRKYLDRRGPDLRNVT
jgi:hypothetical protein